MCRIARELLDGEHRVGRVIARPFTGQPGAFQRTERRHDYAAEPPRPMLLDVLKEAGLEVVGIGKIPDIFLNRGITRALPGRNNREALESTVAALHDSPAGLIFANLIDFDMLYGHRLDIEGYGLALEERWTVGLRSGHAQAARTERREAVRQAFRDELEELLGAVEDR